MSKKDMFRRLQEEARRRGGIAGVSEDCPPEVLEVLLDEIRHCPLCADLDHGDTRPILPRRRDH